MIVLFTMSTAFGWVCDTGGGSCACMTRGGASQEYRILASDFTTAEQDAIEAAADTWDAGSTKVSRGAGWDYVRGTDVSSWSHTNLRFDVATETDTWFANEGVPDNADATTIQRRMGCSRLETDILFRDSTSWQTDLPSLAAGASIAQVAVHEFGHDLGLEHNDSELAIMNSDSPHSGDVGDGRYRIHEDDYDFLTSEYANTSAGNNLMLTRFRTTGSGASEEIWTSTNSSEAGRDWNQAAGTCITSNPPRDIYVDSNSTTSSLTGIEIRWTLSTDTTCFDTDDVLIDEVTYTIVQNASSATVGPAWCIPAGTAGGYYYVCARVDYNDEVAETTAADNTVRSEKLFYVP